ncbi:MAG: hypothetical protein LKG12_03995 [Bifidobacterium tibiigranuli]|jgi:hypothetical protein|nr:hypothetical protein [Bifidobacterium tibiigranuli]
MFDSKKIVRSVVAPVSAVAMLAGLSFVAPSAMAADKLSCDQGTIYGINSSDRSIYSIDTTTGATKQVPGSVLGNNANGLGVNKDGSAAYAVQQAGQSNADVKILKYTAESGSSDSVGTINLGGAVQGSYLVGGAVSPFTDIFYFGGWTSDAKFALFGWNTAKDEALGLLGYVTADTKPGLQNRPMVILRLMLAATSTWLIAILERRLRSGSLRPTFRLLPEPALSQPLRLHRVRIRARSMALPMMLPAPSI